jgi:hypothetical protein
MIRRLRLADHRGREALVALLPVHATTRIHYQGPEGQPVLHRRRIKLPTERIYPPGADPDDVSRALIDGDPDIDLELTGRTTGPCERRWLDQDGHPCYAPSYVEVRTHADGTERARRPLPMRPATLVTARPRVWSGVVRSRTDVIRTEIFTRAYQVAHTTALEFDFLSALAQYLQDGAMMVQVGSGAHGTGALRCERNGLAYRGWLDGHVGADGYQLVLYLAGGALLTGEAPS